MDGKLLIVDDHKQVLNALIQLLEPHFESIKGISNPNQIIGFINDEVFDVILLDMNFSAGVNNGNEGIYWLNRILKSDPAAVVVMITAYADVNLAVRAIKEGAADFVVKPWDNNKLITTLQIAYKLRQSKVENLKLRNRQKQINKGIINQYGPLIGKSKTMDKVLRIVEKVARTDANILVVGENGTGKELIVKEIHNLSRRADEAFVKVDVGAITETLFESEMFGHVKGAFTDAREDKTGWIETAIGGTLFLDEIGNLSLSMQSKLLSAIQNRVVCKVGSNIPIPFDIRLVCATNKNLEEMVSKGLFREDLFYRINTIVIDLPPLRERGEDIVLIAEHFLKEYANKYEKYALRFNNKSLDKLMDYDWPGNVRELRHTIEKAVILCDSDIIKPEDFLISDTPRYISSPTKPLTFEEIEKMAVSDALKNNDGNVLKASKELGLARQTMYNKMHKHNLQKLRNMILKQFYVNVFIRVTLIVLTSIVLGLAINNLDNGYYYTLTGIVLLIIFQWFMLIRKVNKTNIDIERFFALVQNQESAFRFEDISNDKSFSGLYERMNKLNEAIQETKIENERTRQFLRKVVEHIDIGLLSFDSSGAIEIYNKSAKKYFEVQHPSQISALKEGNNKLYNTVNTIKPGKEILRNIRINNISKSILVKATQMKFEDNTIKLVSFDDITNELDRKELESWHKIIRVLTHEIMNSISPVTSLATVISGYFKDNGNQLRPEDIDNKIIEKTISGLNTIEETGKGLLSFVENYRNFTSLPEPNLCWFKVKSLLLNCKQLMESTVMDNVHIKISVSKDDIELYADSAQIELVLINLIKNALESIENKADGNIELKSFYQDDGMVIQVADNGKGIPVDIIDDIFVPFYSTKVNGSGIGLSLSKQIMQNHNGTISVDSIPGKGSCFTLKFPV